MKRVLRQGGALLCCLLVIGLAAVQGGTTGGIVLEPETPPTGRLATQSLAAGQAGIALVISRPEEDQPALSIPGIRLGGTQPGAQEDREDDRPGEEQLLLQSSQRQDLPAGSGVFGPIPEGYSFQVTVSEDTPQTAGDTLPGEEQPLQTQPGSPVTPTSYEPGIVDDVTQEVIRLVNVQRQRNGKDALETDSGLMSAAAVRARELETLYSHTRPDGSSCFTAIGNRGSFGGVAENICMGYATADKIVTAFMNSDGHRKNILGAYDSVGIGVYQDEGGRLYCTQLFGNRIGSGNSGGGTVVVTPGTGEDDRSQQIKQNASLSPGSITVDVGERFYISVDYGVSDLSGYSLRFQSSGTQLSVDGGLVTANEPGQAVVSVSILKGSQTVHILYCHVTIRAPEATPPDPDPEPQPQPQPEPEPDPDPDPEPWEDEDE